MSLVIKIAKDYSVANTSSLQVPCELRENKRGSRWRRGKGRVTGLSAERLVSADGIHVLRGYW